MKKCVLFVPMIFLILSCNSGPEKPDASGSFESDEVLVSAEQSGRILTFTIHEGDKLSKGQFLGNIDVSNIILQKDQVKASVKALHEKLNFSKPQNDIITKQLAAEETQLNYLQREKTRTENLLKADAATPKQLDDVTARVNGSIRQIAVLKQQIRSNKSTTDIKNRNVLSETKPLESSVATIQDQIDKGKIINPITGTVLTQYAFEGEMASFGKALYKIANVDTLTLRAYITGNQIPQVRIGQEIRVFTDGGGKSNATLKNYKGTIYWVSNEAEFTPKTIQTKDERQNLVYAIKVRVINDGSIKIGMYGEIHF